MTGVLITLILGLILLRRLNARVGGSTSSNPEAQVLRLGSIICFLSTPLLLLDITVCISRAADARQAGELLFEKRIRPIVAEHCYRCHGTGKAIKGGLRLNTRDGWEAGGDSGPLVVAGKPEQSLLIEVLRHDGALKMPPTRKLPQSVIDDFERWVKLGAEIPRDASQVQGAQSTSIDIEAGRRHWSFRLPVDHPPPVVRDGGWPQTKIDAFILSRLEAAGLQPAADASRETLIRRLYFDLVGLPPTPEQIDEFLADQAPGARERLVDRLLASPRFGERWARHWLDVVHFAESLTLRGFIFSEAWRYRDYVIDAFDADLPYDQFLREQIAGDLLTSESDGQRETAIAAGHTLKDRQRQLIATTVLTLGNANLEEQDKPQLEMDVIDDQLDLIGRGFLAQTITCARCHDHKFDPIPTRDYYALAGILKNAKSVEHANVSKWIEVPLPQAPEQETVLERHEKKLAALQTHLAERRKVLKRAVEQVKARQESAVVAKRLREEIRRLDKDLKTQRTRGPARPMVMTIVERPKPADLRVHVRGSVHRLGALVPRGFLQVASSATSPIIPRNAGGRLQLADWLVDRGNPLTARVIVNRVWHWLFGAGLVRTTDNFGTTGEAPSHPELLDHLAITFVNDGWSIKRLIRRIVLSRTYRLSADDDARARAVDPENRLLWHRSRRRLDAECLRDAMLQISGALRTNRGGPSYPADLTTDYGYTDKSFRRGVYLPVFRNALPAIFEDFDFADPSLVTGQRSTSTVAPQALFLMNDPFVLEQSLLAANRILTKDDGDDSAKLRVAFRRILGRHPTLEERKLAASFLVSASEADATSRIQAWSQLVQALFATIQFRYVD